MRHYRAIRNSYGFRGRYWTVGDIAENVEESEKIPIHFEPCDATTPPPEEPVRGPETLSEIQEASEPALDSQAETFSELTQPKLKRKPGRPPKIK